MKREPTPTAVAPPPRVYVRLDRVARAHPSLAAMRWQHTPSRPFGLPVSEAPPTETTSPVRVSGRELSLNLAARPDEPMTPEWTPHRAQAETKENAAIDQTFAHARTREANSARFLEEELKLDAEDKLEKLQAKLEEQLHVDKEQAREKTANEIGQIRLKSLPASALETPAQAAQRRADDEKRIQAARARLDATNEQLEAQMRRELAAAERERREEIEKKVRQAQEEQRARPLPEEDVQRRLLHNDFATPSPMRLQRQAPPSPPAQPAPHTITAHEPGLTLRAQATSPNKGAPDLRLIGAWSKDETKSLIQQWAKLYRYELVGFEKTADAVDRTDECLAWLRAGVWKSSRPPGKS